MNRGTKLTWKPLTRYDVSVILRCEPEAVVTVQWRQWQASETLGACSYNSEEDFLADGDYDAMVDAALANLNAELADDLDAMHERIEAAAEVEGA